MAGQRLNGKRQVDTGPQISDVWGNEFTQVDVV